MAISTKAIQRAFPSVGPEAAKALHAAIVDAEIDGDAAVEDTLALADELIDGYGVESIRGSRSRDPSFWMDAVLVYVNMGDPYVATIYYSVNSGRFQIGSWGDWIERYGKRYDVQ